MIATLLRATLNAHFVVLSLGVTTGQNYLAFGKYSLKWAVLLLASSD
jgi:hypothetical protein